MYFIKTNRYDEDPNRKLGSGSEGAVYPFPDDPRLCVKLFHDPDPGDPNAPSLAEYRAKKIGAICSLGLSMPPEFVLPLYPAVDQRRHVKGFLMNRVPSGFVKIMELLKPWRTTNGITLKDIALLFAKLIGTDLKEIAGRNLVVGDINLGCVMVNSNLERRWVDTDSWSYPPNFPCLATTELFAHPDLYPNLERGKAAVLPKPNHDRFALSVMFVQIALTGAHPFRMGIHPKYIGLRERARNGVTIFDSGVTYPKVLPPPEMLSDALIDSLLAVLKRKNEKVPLDAALAEFAKAVTACPNCGAEYHASRPHCPKCHEKTMVDMTILATLLIETLYKAPGTVLHIHVFNNKVRVLYEMQGNLHLATIDDRKRTSSLSTGLIATKGAKYRLFGDCLVVVRNPYAEAPVPFELYCLDGSRVRRIADSSTGVLENSQALVDTSERFLYRTAGNTLMCGSLFGRDTLMEERVAQVHRSQSWFMVDHYTGADREAIFGYDRALREMQWFVIRGEKDASRFTYNEVKMPPMRVGEKLVDFAVYFSRNSVLLVRKTSYRGSEFTRYSVIGLGGKVERDELVGEGNEGYDCWVHLFGKMFQGDSILHVTPKGMVKQTLATNTYHHLEDTEGVITITDQLFRCGTKVGVARRSGLLAISKKV